MAIIEGKKLTQHQHTSPARRSYHSNTSQCRLYAIYFAFAYASLQSMAHLERHSKDASRIYKIEPLHTDLVNRPYVSSTMSA